MCAWGPQFGGACPGTEKGLKEERSFGNPSSPSPRPVPGARVWKLCSGKAARARDLGRSWAAYLDSPSPWLEPLLRASSPILKRPQEFGSSWGGERMPRLDRDRKASMSFLFAAMWRGCLWQPRPFPNFFTLGSGREAIHSGSASSGQEQKGLQKNSASWRGRTRPGAGRRRKPRLDRRSRGDPLLKGAGPLRRLPLLPASPGCFRAPPHFGASRFGGR